MDKTVGQLVPGADLELINGDLAPTRPEQRTWSMWHIAALWVGMAVCVPTYLLAANLVDQGWSLGMAVGSVALGNLIILIPLVLNAHPGTRYGVPFPVLLRSSFGVRGANLPALLRAFVACGWFGIQTWIGGDALYKLFVVLVPGVSLPDVVPAFVGINTGQLIAFLAFWALNVAIILRGMESIRALEAWSAPFLIGIGLALLWWAWSKTGSFSALIADPRPPTQHGLSALAVGITGAVAFWGTLALNIPDFGRFAKSQRDQLWGQTIGLPATMVLFAFVGAVVTNASAKVFGERISDPVELVSRIGGPALTIIAMLGLAIATLSTNLAANVVSPANDFSNLAPRKIDFRRGALITSVLGIVIMPWKLLSDGGAYIFTWLLGYGALLGAVGGIMIADYYLVRRKVLSVPDLYRRGGRYEYRAGWNPIAVGALVVGVALNLPGFLGALGVMTPPALFARIYEWAWFVGFFAAGGVYLVGMKLSVRAPASGPGVAPSA